MAKKSLIPDNIFSRTEPTAAGADTSDLDSGRITTQGVGLREGELDALRAMAERLGGKDAGVTVNGLMRLAVRMFLVDVRTGKIDPGDFYEEPKQPKKRQKLPG